MTNMAAGLAATCWTRST